MQVSLECFRRKVYRKLNKQRNAIAWILVSSVPCLTGSIYASVAFKHFLLALNYIKRFGLIFYNAVCNHTFSDRF